jgi:hypothetical protein
MKKHMGTVKKNWERMFPMSPYFVQARAFERRLLREAFAAAKKPAQVAAMLGVSQRFLQLRVRYLGGIEPGSIPVEPPQVSDEAARQRGLAAAAAANLARKARKAAAAAGEQVAPSVAPAPILTPAVLSAAPTEEVADEDNAPDDADLSDDADDEAEDDGEESDDPLVAALYD